MATDGETGDRVVIAYDGSPLAQRAITQAADLLSGEDVVVVTVWEENLAMAGSGFGLASAGGAAIAPGLVKELAESAREHAERVAEEGRRAAQTAGLDARAVVRVDSGGVADTILETARELEASVIVAGSHGSGGVLGRLMGGTCSGLIEHAPCPLLIVREQSA